MKRYWLLMLASASPVLAQTPWPDAAVVAEVMRRANDYWITNNGVGNAGWARGAYYTGNQRAFRVLGERGYWTWANAWANVNLWKIGPEGPNNADAFCCGQTYIDLYQLDPQPQYIADIQTQTDALVASPAVDGWWWIDAFYMQGPVLARLGNVTGDTNYFEKLWAMYEDMKTRRGLFDPAESLWYRDASYFYPAVTTSNGFKVFWSRGNGWVFAGLARVLQQMTTNAPHYGQYVGMFQNIAAALKPIQQSDGMWRSSLYDPAEFPNPETSGTGFFTYGLAWGIRNGLLAAADYTNTVLLAWHGLTNLALNAAGRVGYCQNVGAQPAPAFETNTTDFGVGAFLLACSELYLLTSNAPALRPWAGPDQTLLDTNRNGFEPLSLQAQWEVYRGAAGAVAWWQGTNQVASGAAWQTNLGLGTHVFTVKVTGEDSVTYSDCATITVMEPVSVIPVPMLRFDFEDSGSTTMDSVSGVTLALADAAGAPVDLHGAPGTGVSDAGRALDFTPAVAQGNNGPLAWTTAESSMPFGTVTAFTITLWIKPHSSLWLAAYPRLFSLGTNGTTDRGNLGSLQLLSNGNLQPATAMQAYVNSTQSSTSGFGACDLPVDQWRFLALTYDGVALQLYGGSETGAVTLLSSAVFPAGAVPVGDSWSLFLGNRLGRDRAFDGWMDDVRFYLEAAPLGFLETVRQAALPSAHIEPIRAGTNLLLRMSTRLNQAYVLESTANLAVPGTWSPVLTNLGTGGFVTNSIPITPATAGSFFRYRLQ